VPPSDRVVGGLVALLSLRVITRPRSPGAIIPNTAGSGTGWESDQSIPLFETTAWSPVANSWPWLSRTSAKPSQVSAFPKSADESDFPAP
jgi:hypothetical protein